MITYRRHESCVIGLVRSFPDCRTRLLPTNTTAGIMLFAKWRPSTFVDSYRSVCTILYAIIDFFPVLVLFYTYIYIYIEKKKRLVIMKFVWKRGIMSRNRHRHEIIITITSETSKNYCANIGVMDFPCCVNALHSLSETFINYDFSRLIKHMF